MKMGVTNFLDYFKMRKVDQWLSWVELKSIEPLHQSSINIDPVIGKSLAASR
jgi:hypothetical protein